MSFVQLITSCCFVLGCMLMAVSADASELNWNIVKKLEQNQKAYNALIAKAEKNQIGYSVLLDEVRRLKKERYGYISEAKKARRALRQKHREEKKLTTDERKFYVEINEQINKPTKTTISKSKAVAAHSKGQLKSINAKDKKDYYARNPGIEKRSNPKGIAKISSRQPSSKTQDASSQKKKTAPKKKYTYNNTKSSNSADIRQFTKASYRPTYVKTETKVEHKVVENQKAYAASKTKFPTPEEQFKSPVKPQATVKFTNNKEVVTGKLPKQEVSRIDGGFDQTHSFRERELVESNLDLNQKSWSPDSNSEGRSISSEGNTNNYASSGGLKPPETYYSSDSSFRKMVSDSSDRTYSYVPYATYDHLPEPIQKIYKDAIRVPSDGKSLQVVDEKDKFTDLMYKHCEPFTPDGRFNMKKQQAKDENGQPILDRYGQPKKEVYNLGDILQWRFDDMLVNGDLKARYTHFKDSFSDNVILDAAGAKRLSKSDKVMDWDQSVAHVGMFKEFTEHFSKIKGRPVLRGAELNSRFGKNDKKCSKSKTLKSLHNNHCTIQLSVAFTPDGKFDKKRCEDEGQEEIFVFEISPQNPSDKNDWDNWHIVALKNPEETDRTGENAKDVFNLNGENFMAGKKLRGRQADMMTGQIFFGRGEENTPMKRLLDHAALGPEFRPLVPYGMIEDAKQAIAAAETPETKDAE